MKFAKDSQVLIQGITEPLGELHATLMKDYGTNVVAGVSPGCGGQKVGEIPVFDLVEQAIATVGTIDTSMIFVPPYGVLDAAYEAIAAGVRQIIIVTAGVPPLDMVKLVRKAEATETLVVGPNCPGIIVPGRVLLGTHPGQLYSPGSVGIISCSGTLTYQVALELTQAGLGQSVVVGIGCDAIVGSSFSQWLQILDEDEHTEVIVVVGETTTDGGEELAAHYIAEAIDKPVIAYIAGQHAPVERRWSHASNLLAAKLSAKKAKEGNVEADDADSVNRKIAAFKQRNISLVERPSDMIQLLNKLLTSSKQS